MYISKKEATKEALKWIDRLKKLSQRDNPSWLYIGAEARETLGQIFTLWNFGLLSDKQWDEFYHDIWTIKNKAENALNRTF